MIKRNILTIVFLILFSALFEESNYQLSFTNENKLFDIPYQPGINYDNYKTLDFNSIYSKPPSSSIEIKSQGTPPDQLNTISADGGLAQHTRTALNGLVIENSQNNVLDLSVLPLEFASSIDVYKNNLSPYGISASSGLVNFNLFPVNNLSYLSFYMGSYANYGGKLLLNKEINNSRFYLGLAASSADNDFIYEDQFSATNKASNPDYKKYSIIGRWQTSAFDLILTHTGKEAGTGNKYSGQGRQSDLFSTVDFTTSLNSFNFNLNYINWQNKYWDTINGTNTHLNQTIGVKCDKKINFQFMNTTIKLADNYYILNSTQLGNKSDDDVKLALGRF